MTTDGDATLVLGRRPGARRACPRAGFRMPDNELKEMQICAIWNGKTQTRHHAHSARANRTEHDSGQSNTRHTPHASRPRQPTTARPTRVATRNNESRNPITRAANGNGHVSCLEMTKLAQGGRPGRQPHSSSAGGCVTVSSPCSDRVPHTQHDAVYEYNRARWGSCAPRHSSTATKSVSVASRPASGLWKPRAT